jgi:hypothetical protein
MRAESLLQEAHQMIVRASGRLLQGARGDL